jgi:hypothetical protein
MESAERRLNRLGITRGRRLMRWLYEADKALKGSHAQDARGVFVLERLLHQVAATPSRNTAVPRPS